MLNEFQQSLIAAGLHGNRGFMDRAELEAISFLVHPHHADGRPLHPDPRDYPGMVFWPTDLLRAWGPGCILAVVWSIVPPCGRCWRRLSRRRGCVKCQGKGFIAEDWSHDLITDVDGLVLEDGDGNKL